MTEREFLVSKGWRLISEGKRYPNTTNYWDHPNHQPARHGAFMQNQAMAHQKFVDKNGSCSCIPRDGGNLR